MTQFAYKEYVYPRTLNWKQIFEDIHKEGYTAMDVSLLIGAKWSTMQRWREGVEPRHSIGESILTLHTRYCGEDLTNQRITEAMENSHD